MAGPALFQSPAASMPSHGDPGRLLAASHGVQASGVRGVAWYVDPATDKVVVTVDRTVSRAEVARIQRSAGADASALQIRHATGVFRPLVSAGDAMVTLAMGASSQLTGLDAAIVIDTTGSMGDEISYLTAELLNISNAVRELYPAITSSVGPATSWYSDHAVVRKRNSPGS